MRKILLIILNFIFLQFAFVNAFAQESDDKDSQKQSEVELLKNDVLELNRENKSLKSEIEKLQKDVKNLESDKKKLESDKEKLQNDLAKSKAENIKLTNEKYDTIKYFKNEIKKLKDNQNQKKIDQLNASRERLESQHEDDEKKLIEKNKEIESLKKELAQFQSLKNDYLKLLETNVDEKWLNKSFSQIDINNLKEEVNLYSRYADENADVKTALDNLKTLLDNTKVYKSGVDCINSEYEKTSVDETLQSVQELENRISQLNQKEEVTELRKTIDDYLVTVQLFQTLIEEIEKQIGNNKSNKAAYPLVEATINKMDEDVTSIVAIPWLKEQWEEYEKVLKEDCISSPNNKVRNLIMNLKTE